CITGRPPFKAPSDLETIKQVEIEDPVEPRRLQPGIPRDLQTMCLKCLQKNAKNRYANAAALADDLHRFLEGECIHARPVSVIERSWKSVKRKPVVSALLAGI